MPESSESRILTFAAAIREATEQLMEEDERVVLFGLGATDPKGIFGTTVGLAERFGASRVLEPPTAENGTAGIALGACLAGMRPIVAHQRVEFALLAIDPLVNQAAKWHYMTGGKQKAPLVFRMIVGRGWGQGPQHSQSLETWFAHVPGLKVVVPATAHDAKGLLIASVRDDNPVVFMESRWSHGVTGHVPESLYETTIGKARIAREGSDVTIVSYSFPVIEALQAGEFLASQGIDAEVVDLRSLRPLDANAVEASVAKTGRLLSVDFGWSEYGVSSEIVAQISMRGVALKAPPRRIGLTPGPIPSTRALANLAYPGAKGIVEAVLRMFDRHDTVDVSGFPDVCDVPDPSFIGPF
ncbi:MAG: Acetoin:2,6-dichlorophenolindophenol oxidoreductase subunit beta [Nitrosomonadaceae bacterium]|nr:Acetoin:2,6-dichlorophenolindophenol oxidoreductase subunit beta [Nitrosomonadaceae bacterium]